MSERDHVSESDDSGNDELDNLLQEIHELINANEDFVKDGFDKYKYVIDLQQREDLESMKERYVYLGKLQDNIDTYFTKYCKIKADMLSDKLLLPQFYAEKLGQISAMITTQQSSQKQCREDLQTLPTHLRELCGEIKTGKEMISQLEIINEIQLSIQKLSNNLYKKQFWQSSIELMQVEQTFKLIDPSLYDTLVFIDLKKSLERRKNEICRGIQNFTLEYQYLFGHNNEESSNDFSKTKAGNIQKKPNNDSDNFDQIKLLKYIMGNDSYEDTEMCSDFIIYPKLIEYITFSISNQNVNKITENLSKFDTKSNNFSHKDTNVKSSQNFYIICKTVNLLQYWDDFKEVFINGMNISAQEFLIACFSLSKNDLNRKVINLPTRRQFETKFSYKNQHEKWNYIHSSIIRKTTEYAYEFITLYLGTYLRIVTMLRELTYFLILCAEHKKNTDKGELKIFHEQLRKILIDNTKEVFMQLEEFTRALLQHRLEENQCDNSAKDSIFGFIIKLKKEYSLDFTYLPLIINLWGEPLVTLMNKLTMVFNSKVTMAQIKDEQLSIQVARMNDLKENFFVILETFYLEDTIETFVHPKRRNSDFVRLNEEHILDTFKDDNVEQDRLEEIFKDIAFNMADNTNVTAPGVNSLAESYLNQNTNSGGQNPSQKNEKTPNNRRGSMQIFFSNFDIINKGNKNVFSLLQKNKFDNCKYFIPILPCTLVNMKDQLLLMNTFSDPKDIYNVFQLLNWNLFAVYRESVRIVNEKNYYPFQQLKQKFACFELVKTDYNYIMFNNLIKIIPDDIENVDYTDSEEYREILWKGYLSILQRKNKENELTEFKDIRMLDYSETLYRLLANFMFFKQELNHIINNLFMSLNENILKEISQKIFSVTGANIEMQTKELTIQKIIINLKEKLKKDKSDDPDKENNTYINIAKKQYKKSKEEGFGNGLINFQGNIIVAVVFLTYMEIKFCNLLSGMYCNLKTLIHQLILGNLSVKYDCSHSHGQYKSDTIPTRDIITGSLLLDFYRNFKVLSDKACENLDSYLASIFFEESVFLIHNIIEWDIMESLTHLWKNLPALNSLLQNTAQNLKDLKIYECETSTLARSLKNLSRFITKISVSSQEELIDMINDSKRPITQNECEQIIAAQNIIDKQKYLEGKPQKGYVFEPKFSIAHIMKECDGQISRKESSN